MAGSGTPEGAEQRLDSRGRGLIATPAAEDLADALSGLAATKRDQPQSEQACTQQDQAPRLGCPK